MHVFRLFLLLGCTFFRIVNAEYVASVSIHCCIECSEITLHSLTVSLNLNPDLKPEQSIYGFIITLEKYSSTANLPGFGWLSNTVTNLNFENLYRITAYKEVVGDHNSDNVTSNTNVYGLISVYKNEVTGYINVPSSKVFPSGATLYLEPLKQQQQQNDNETLHPPSACHQFNVPYNLTIFPVDMITLEKPTDTLYPTVQNLKQFQSINQNSTSYRPENFQRQFNRRVKRSSTEVPTNTPTLDTVRAVHRPGETEPYIMELFMVVDETLAAEFRGQYDQLVYRVNMIMALVNKLFSPFNIIIVIVRLEIWEQDRISLKVEEHHILTALAQFKRMHTDIRHDCLHALLGTKEQGSRTRGKANHMTMCIYSRCVGYSRVSPTFDITETARTMAHELGHNFGLRHDTEECECQGCIMATGVEFGTTVMKWSPCSIRDLPGLLKYGMGVCLHDMPARGRVSINTFLVDSKTATKNKNNHKDSNNNNHYYYLNMSVPSVVHIYDWQSESKRNPVSRVLTPARQRHSISSSSLSPSASSKQYMDGLCGNGQLDPGEECDCGSQTSCPKEWQACCDPTRCKLRKGAECAGGPCCDIVKTNPNGSGNQSSIQCKLKASGTICRNESGNCDLPEYCDGQSQWCPADVYKADGELCYTDEGRRAHCVRGGCRDADGWCRVLWGKTATIADKYCFYENEVWDRKPTVDSVANCGINRPLPRDRWEDVKTWSGIACETWHDTSCGRLWCHHQNEKAMLLGWIQSQTRVIHSTGRSCSALVYDPVWPASDPVTWDKNKLTQINANGAGFGLYSANTQDAGMVPDGTPCSRGMCYNGSCKSIDEIRSPHSCYCNGRGICNNLGHCHCAPGYKPPNCEEGGNGGSIDSGPPPFTHIKDNTLLVIICILFFVILPACGLTVYFLCIRPGRCLLSTSKEFIYTSSGLRRPFDKNCTDCLCHFCRRSSKTKKSTKESNKFRNPYPLLAYTTTDAQETTDGHTVVINGRTNGYPNNYKSSGKLSNGDTHKAVKSNTKSVSFEIPTSNKLLSGGGGKTGSYKHGIPSNTVFVGSETAAATTAKITTTAATNKHIHREPQKATTNVISKYDQNGIVVPEIKPTQIIYPKYPKISDQIVHKTSTKLYHHHSKEQPPAIPNEMMNGTASLISEPRLERMTYEGSMCSLNDAAAVINTLKRKSKESTLTGKKTQSNVPVEVEVVVGNNSQSIVTTAKQKLLNNNDSTTLQTGKLHLTQTTPIRSTLTPKDISEPLLQTTTYNETLSDLQTARLKLSQKVFEL
uniref:Peptidase M12B domain-containing protein n=2 Tax=Trichobilharzia regenti TaxID=157069 RepID=A0AA85IMH1_TRIRE|nr:unnamed protein product [Trichobilharzia regenti]